MALTPQEKAVGRVFRDQCADELHRSFDTDPPDYTVPDVLALFRHLCSARGLKSTALELREIYVSSPASDGVPHGRFGFIYRAGRCRWCGQTARSRTFRLVDRWDRPPLG